MDDKKVFESDGKQTFPIYDVVKVVGFRHSEIIDKLIHTVNEKIAEGYVPVGGIAVVNAHPTYCAYQAIMLSKQNEDAEN